MDSKTNPDFRKVKMCVEGDKGVFGSEGSLLAPLLILLLT